MLEKSPTTHVSQGNLLSIPIKKLKFAGYVGALSGVIVLVSLLVYFWAHLREPYAAFELLLTFALAILIIPVAVIFRDAWRKRKASTTDHQA